MVILSSQAMQKGRWWACVCAWGWLLKFCECGILVLRAKLIIIFMDCREFFLFEKKERENLDCGYKINCVSFGNKFPFDTPLIGDIYHHQQEARSWKLPAIKNNINYLPLWTKNSEH